MIPGVRLVVLGKQGAGKGTQCVRLSHHYVVPHVSTGDMLRGEVKSKTPFGVRAQSMMEIDTSLVMKRLASRRVCVDCGANYSTAAPPMVNWTCDVCGGEVVQREDDTEEAIERRLDLYEAETAPLIAWYSERDLLVPVNGTGSPDAVTRRVVGAIDTRRQIPRSLS